MAISLESDYNRGAHPRIFQRLMEVNEDTHRVYGNDDHCASATSMIRELIGQPAADVVYISGGTQTNHIALSFCLRPWEAVVACRSGHISFHETGTVESTGHKVITVDSENGKLYPHMLQAVLQEHAVDVHMVVPKMVYLSQTTELGTLYTLQELRELRAFCDKHDLLLHLDGARLGFALASEANDLKLKDIGSLVDSFHFGGTKVGAMFGEALVLVNPALRQHPGIRHAMKQRGALLAKGWMLGVQFETLLEDNAKLLMELCGHANRMAKILKDALESCGYPAPIAGSTNTNLIFAVFPVSLVEALEKEFKFGKEEFYRDENGNVERILVRFVTIWCTKEDQCRRFVDVFRRLAK